MDATELRAMQDRRRRGLIMSWVREGHMNQLSRMDDLQIWGMFLKLGLTVGREQVITLLQDLAVLEYIDFKQGMDEDSGRTTISQIQLTAAGLRFMTLRRSNDDVQYNQG
jgi:hypothetical protein